MSADSSSDVTRLLLDWSDGDGNAAEELMPLVYDELRRRAASYFRRERPGQVLQATALVHETYLRLIDQRSVAWRNRLHFFALAAKMMRRILVDDARSRLSGKRGGDLMRVTLADGPEFAAEQPAHLLALDDALTGLRQANPDLARIVELRFFGGFKNEEISELLGVSIPTITRRWRLAKAWLLRRMSEGAGGPGEVGDGGR